MSNQNTINVTEATFTEEVIQSGQPVLVDFWAAWCGPCKMIAPILDEIADDYAGRAKVAKVDVDANQQLAHQYGIRAIPTLLVFSGGEMKDQITGFTSKEAITAKLDALTGAAG